MTPYPSARVIVIYDGECGVCQALKHWLERRDAQHCLKLIPYQIAQGEEVASFVPLDQMKEALFLISEKGKVYRGAQALLELLKRLTGFWKGVGIIFTFLPLSLLLEPFYRLFARYRRPLSKILGLKNQSCRLNSFHKAR